MLFDGIARHSPEGVAVFDPFTYTVVTTITLIIGIMVPGRCKIWCSGVWFKTRCETAGFASIHIHMHIYPAYSKYMLCMYVCVHPYIRRFCNPLTLTNLTKSRYLQKVCDRGVGERQRFSKPCTHTCASICVSFLLAFSFLLIF